LTYEIKYHPAVKEDLNKLDNTSKLRIKRAIEARLAVEPIKWGEPLKGSLKGFQKLRIGDYRVVYKNVGKKILILGIRHRKDIYEIIRTREK